MKAHAAPPDAASVIPSPAEESGDRASAELAQLGFEAAATGIVLLNAEGVILHANRAFAAIVGRSVPQLVGTRHELLSQPAFREKLRQLAAAPAGPGFEIEGRYTHTGGTLLSTAETVTAARPPGAAATLFIVVVRDVSREKAGAASAGAIKVLSDETSEAHLLINSHGAIIYANNAASVMTGRTREALLRSRITDIWDGLSLADFHAFFTRAVEQRVTVDAAFHHTDGSRRAVNLHAFVSEFGGEPLLTALVGDQTENVRVREALRESEARLRIAVDIAQLSVYGWDPATGALNWDARLKAMWGLPPDAHVDYDVFWSGVHPDDKPMVGEALRRTLDPADGFYQAEFRVIGLRDGVERWVVACGQTFFKAGQPVGYIGAALDITARKRIEKDLEHVVTERTGELREIVTELEAFSYSISHDMRAPLRAIRGYAEVLAEECSDDISATGRDYIRRIRTAGERMDRLIQGALDYSRMTRAEVPLGPVDLNALVNAIITDMPNYQLPKANVEIVGVLPVVRGNYAALTQCFSNLIANGVKFVPTGTLPHVQIFGQTAGSRAQISVRDNGIGIDPVAHEKVFDLFYRLNPRVEGTGIGLAIARRAIQRMNGTITIESTPGHGATFIIDLEASGF